MVNDITTVDEAGETVVTPRPEAELEDLRMLVASAVGFDAERGDEITIRSMTFEALPVLGTEAGGGEVPSAPLDVMRLAQTGVLALVALILGLFVIRPILTSSRPSPALLDNSSGASANALARPGGSVIDGVATSTAGSTANAEDDRSNTAEDPVDRLRGMIEDRREEAIQVLQSWIDEPAAETGK